MMDVHSFERMDRAVYHYDCRLKAPGLYEASECLVENGTDPSLFVDNNKANFIYGNGYIARLNDDLQ